MSDVRTNSGFRSLVEKIQENDGGVDERQRVPRRRLTLPSNGREGRPAPTMDAAPSVSAAPVRLLQRRWL